MDIIVDLVLYLVFFAAGYLYSHMLLINRVIKLNKGRNTNKSQDSVIEIELSLNQLSHEIIGAENYFYTVSDKSFVCQAKTLEEAALRYLDVKTPHSVGWFVHCENNKKYCFANGEVQEINDE